MARSGNRGRRSNKVAKKIKFDHQLVLTNWMLELFAVATFEDLGKHIRDPAFEGFNEDGISRFHQCLKLIFDCRLPNYGSAAPGVVSQRNQIKYGLFPL